MAIGDSNVSHGGRVLGRVDHLTVCKKIFNRKGTTLAGKSHLDSRLFPPAPLTGDVGRGCGDASRALLLCALERVCAFQRDRLPWVDRWQWRSRVRHSCHDRL